MADSAPTPDTMPDEQSPITVVPSTPPVVAPPGPPRHTERRKHSVGWRTRDILRTAVLVIGLYVVIQLLWFANELFLTAFLALLFGLALSAVVDRLERIGLPRGVAAPGVVVALIAILFTFGVLSAPTLVRQGTELQRRLPDAIDAVEHWFNAQHGTLGFLMGGSRPTTDSTQAARHADSIHALEAVRTGRGVPQRGARTARTDTVVVQSPTPVAPGATLRQRLAEQLAGATRYLFPFLTSTLAVLAGLLLIVFVSIYVAIDTDMYHRGLMHLFPHRHRERAGEVLSAIAYTLRQWFIAQLIAMLVIGTVSTIALLALHVRAPLVLGFIAGILEFIPFFGPIISAVPAIAMGFLDSPGKAFWVMIAYLIIQELEGHILIPILMKEGVDLPPVLTILAQALMVLVFGFLGLMVAVPMLAAIIVPVKMLYVSDVVGDQVEVAGVEEEEDEEEDDDEESG